MKLLTILLLLQLSTASIDLNTAPKEKLITLEGVTPEIADQIIKGRPYKAVEELTKEKALKEVWEKNKLKVCISIDVRLSICSGNRIDKMMLDALKEKSAEAPPK